MLKDIQAIAEQIGWPLAVGLFVLVISEKTGLMSIKIGGGHDPSEAVKALDVRVDALEIKIARIDAVIEDRKTR